MSFKNGQTNRTKTVFPTEKDVSTSNLPNLVGDIPRTYQIELCLHGLFTNTVVYLPTSSGKTLVSAMIAKIIKQLNPNKKVLFVCDRISLLFQQAAYLRFQCGDLNVGEYCGQSKGINMAKNQTDQDVLVLTADFLFNILTDKKFFLEDCCLLVIDDFHHARDGHTFLKLIQNFYANIDAEYRPRIIGMTSFPPIAAIKPEAMQNELIRLCNLIEGTISTPTVHKIDLDRTIARPRVTFIPAIHHMMEDVLIDELNNLLTILLAQLNSTAAIGKKVNIRDRSLKEFIRNILLDTINITPQQKRFTIAQFAHELFESVEIIDVVGLTKTIECLKNIVDKETKKQHVKDWTKNLKKRVNQFSSFISSGANLSGISDRYLRLKAILREYQSSSNKLSNKNPSKIIVLVRSKKTCRSLCQQLCQEESAINEFWQPHEEHDALRTNNKLIASKCRLLISTYLPQEGTDVPKFDRVILFDSLWSSLLAELTHGRVPYDSNQIIIIGTIKEAESYKNLIKHEKDLDGLVGSMVQNNFNSPLLARQISHLKSNNEPSEQNIHKHIKLPKKRLNFTLQVYLAARNPNQNNLYLFNNHLKSSTKGLVRFTNISDCYIADDFFEKPCEIVNCYFEKRVAAATAAGKSNETTVVFETIQAILQQNNADQMLALHWLNPKHKSLSRPNAQFLLEQITFGNLATPFEFIPTSQVFENSKIVIDYSSKTILLYMFVNSVLYKFEIRFECIDRLICLDDIEGDKFINLFLPLNRTPFIYKLFLDEYGQRVLTEQTIASIEDDYLNWDRISFENIGITFRLMLKIEEKPHLIESLYALDCSHILFCHVNINPKETYSFDTFKSYLNKTDFESQYNMEVFLTQHDYMLIGKMTPAIARIFNDYVTTEGLKKILENLSNDLLNKRYLNLANLLLSAIHDAQKINRSPLIASIDDLLPPEIISNKISSIKRATVTPSKVIYYFPEVIRKFGVEKFLRIRFRDEDQLKLSSASSSKMPDIYERIKRLLKSGIDICGRHYDFLAMASSQLREHGCWLYLNTSTQDNADVVRRWMGDFSRIKIIGKYAARLGQSLSSSIETFSTSIATTIADVKSADNEYCFTDGIGKISARQAKEICEEYYNNEMASAFQIRFAGFKGVVAVDPRLNGDTEPLQFRESMKKFDSGYNRLDVLNVAEPIPCYLNRQIIIILSALGIPDSTFSDLQDTYLRSISEILVDNRAAKEAILTYYRSVYSFAQHNEIFNYTQDAFFRDLLKTIYQKNLQGLILKSRIPIKKGRILMGTIDEFDVLKEDQVFVQCRPLNYGENENYEEIKWNSSGKFIVESTVIVAKNPCMHPGDVRVLQAVDVPELRHMFDCVVFPAVGKRPITSMCSGSDLDGDLYFVSWEPTLIPAQVQAPMDYKAPASKLHDEPIQITHVIDFFVNFIEMDQLGRIASAHVALSDQMPNGVKDPECIKLAQLFSLAVDFPKHGLVVSLPANLKSLKYPDFMGRNRADSYESQKIIGKMYRKCKSIFFTDDFITRTHFSTIQINTSLLIDGYKQFVSEARQLYDKYRTEIERLMTRFGCKHEAELFVGLYMGSSHTHSDEARGFFKLGSILIKNLWTYMREKFMETPQNCSNMVKDYRLKKASAWYFTCYTHEANKKRRILSFPWIVEDFICKLKISNFDFFACSLLTKFDSIHVDLMNHFGNKIELKNEIVKLIDSKLIMCGTFGLFLFENATNEPMQLYLLDPKLKIDENLENCIQNVFDNTEVNENNNNRILKAEHSKDIAFTIACSLNTALRYLYIRRMIFRNPVLLPVLYTIMHFARFDQLFLKLTDDKINFDAYVEFSIGYFVREKYVDDLEDRKDILNEFMGLGRDDGAIDCVDEWLDVFARLEKNCKKMSEFEDLNCGRMLINFYKDHAYFNNSNKYKFVTSVVLPDPNKSMELSEKTSEHLTKHFFKAFNLLSKTTNVSDVWFLMNEKPQTEFKRQRRRRDMIIIRNYAHENAYLLLFSNLKSDSDRVEFKYYNGTRHSYHLGRQCYLSNNISSQMAEFSEFCLNKFVGHSMQQIEGAGSSRFELKIKLGDIYFTNIPGSYLEQSSSVPLDLLRKSLNEGYKKCTLVNSSGARMNLLTNTASDNDENDPMPVGLLAFRNNNKRRNGLRDVIGAKKKKKNRVSYAYSAFNSNVKETTTLNSLLIENGFETRVEESYQVYLELKNLLTEKKKEYLIKYDNDMKWIQTEFMPIKWCSIDIRNNCIGQNTRDLRFSLASENIPNDVDEDSFWFGLKSSLNEHLKAGIIKKDQIEAHGQLRVVNDFRNQSNIYVKHLTSTLYNGNFANWKGLFDFAKVEIPNDLNTSMLSVFNVALCEVNEHSENDVKEGLFQTNLNKKEVLITANINLIKLKEREREIHDLVMWSWYLSQTLLKI